MLTEQEYAPIRAALFDAPPGQDAEDEIAAAVAKVDAAHPEWLIEMARAYRRHRRANSAVERADGRYTNTCRSGCVVAHTEAVPADCNEVWAQAEEAATMRLFQLHALAEAAKTLGGGDPWRLRLPWITADGAAVPGRRTADSS